MDELNTPCKNLRNYKIDFGLKKALRAIQFGVEMHEKMQIQNRNSRKQKIVDLSVRQFPLGYAVARLYVNS